MKKKQYIQPALLVVNMSNTEVICTSDPIHYGGSNQGRDDLKDAEAGYRRGNGWDDYENY